ncbi:MAG: membrane protein insertase YidC, partial [Deltaproteobacteria bacterium]|nr:membrane protein insertase YidC [Deltaproteobacteria bacterium]
EPGKQIITRYKLYMGPKETDELEKFGNRLEESLDLSLKALSMPLLAMLQWFYGLAGNWGVAIILLTLVVRVVLFPLTYKGMVSMKRLQKLQPKVTALKERLKNDKDKFGKELMGLYRKHKVNPLNGCLPMLLQIPIFFALYSALMGAIELRHTEFFGWITDLSAKDGLYILPVLMGASMFFQQKMSPPPADALQAKMFQFLPLILTVFMLNFPSGLVLYWTVSNLLSILQQVVINRAHIPEPQD